MIQRISLVLLCCYTLGRVDCIVKECNTTVDMLPGTVVQLVNPLMTDKERDTAVTCWYTVRLVQGVSEGIFRISVDRFSVGRLEKHLCVGGHLQVN